VVPSIEIDGRAMPVLHVSQIASLLDLPAVELPANPRLAFDTVNVLSSWVDILDDMSWEQITAPTRSRGRSIRNLTVNTFHPFELLPTAWRDGRFDWYPEEDQKREDQLHRAEDVRAYARERLLGWQMFLLDVEDELEQHDPFVESPRGDAYFSAVLTSQRWHCAFHHRQLVHYLEECGASVEDLLDVEIIHDLDLPENVY
jgi:hypothetical protein